MDVKIEELIAIGASITANCKPCIEYHVAKARENGANDQEIAEAVDVGKMVRKGAATQMDKFIPGALAGNQSGEDKCSPT
ncbi:MAG: carboxymuconolactone decarboxylase family protein [Planctomycetota bacterium]|jgi:AhpD family alkylhydroperoxidase